MIINVGESSAKATSYDDTTTQLGVDNVQDAISIINNKVPFKFGTNGDGDYGYYKADDSFVPFNRLVYLGRITPTTSNYPYNTTVSNLTKTFTIPTSLQGKVTKDNIFIVPVSIHSCSAYAGRTSILANCYHIGGSINSITDTTITITTGQMKINFIDTGSGAEIHSQYSGIATDIYIKIGEF